MHQAKINLATIQVHAADLHPHPCADGVTNTSPLATQLLPRFVKAEILATQLGDVDQAFHIHRVQRDKNAKASGRCDHAAELFTQMLAHVFALEPGLYVAAGLISAALVGTAVQAGSLPGELVSSRLFRLLFGVFNA